LHFGYVNLTPLVYGLLASEELNELLERMEAELLSEYGMRSLSNQDQFYRYGSDYYRGKIFIWQNYMVLKGL
jgi:mannosyl-oligosaccharide glucosidase